MLNEKNACPRASRKVPLSIFERSGLNRNSTPAIAPGSINEHTTSTNNRMNSSGIISFDAFSIPFSMPLTMTKCVIPTKTAIQKTGLHGLCSNCKK